MQCQAFIQVAGSPCCDEQRARRAVARLHGRHVHGAEVLCEPFDLVTGLWTIALPRDLAERARIDLTLSIRFEQDGEDVLVLVELP